MVFQILRRVHDDQLWIQGGYNGFSEYLAKTQVVSRTTAYRLLTIVERFNEPQLTSMGMVRLMAAMQYHDALSEPLTAANFSTARSGTTTAARWCTGAAEGFRAEAHRVVGSNLATHPHLVGKLPPATGARCPNSNVEH